MPGTSSRLVAAVLAASFAVTAPAPSAAQSVPLDPSTRRAARQLAREGGALFDAGRYAEAVERLSRAYTLVPAPTIAVLEAEALIELGRLVEAAERYEAASHFPVDESSSKAFRRAVGEARIQAAKMRSRIPQLVVVVEEIADDTESLQVRIGDQVVPRALLGVRRPTDPGEHVVSVTLPDGRSDTRRVTLEEGEQKRVVLTPRARSAHPLGSGDATADETAALPHQSTLGWVGLGVGGAGLATGVVAGLVMLGKQSSLDDRCAQVGSEMACPEDARDDLDAFRSAKTVSWIGYGVGVVGAGLGLALLLTAPSPAEQSGPALHAFLGLGQGGVRGRF